MYALLTILSLASTGLAYQITYPGPGVHWSCTGPNPITWNGLATDPTSFAVVLVNDKYGTADVCAPLLYGYTGQGAIYPPYGRAQFIPGDGYHLNIVQDYSHPEIILAQSAMFSIDQCNAYPPPVHQPSAHPPPPPPPPPPPAFSALPHIPPQIPEPSQLMHELGDAVAR
ncbi:hypothetical protein EW146_g2457 [Bondarzewia mesenterica]|uniref:Yeast cell wall synthesis Kre9/Knh1-like N-terminal domain-containing protein n=1 Tax=Bondarzewia mesenterica TaxID=1095465 RepID=A0A4V3XFR8_9AGAM|nr:hypothetical protein EW146_g2457 [Bondarzewia mesenterica]